MSVDRCRLSVLGDINGKRFKQLGPFNPGPDLAELRHCRLRSEIITGKPHLKCRAGCARAGQEP